MNESHLNWYSRVINFKWIWSLKRGSLSLPNKFRPERPYTTAEKENETLIFKFSTTKIFTVFIPTVEWYIVVERFTNVTCKPVTSFSSILSSFGRFFFFIGLVANVYDKSFAMHIIQINNFRWCERIWRIQASEMK